MDAIKFTKEHRNPFLFENDDYRMEYLTSSTDSKEYTYSVYDKKQKSNMRLEFSTDKSDSLCIALYRDGEKPLHLKAVEPYLYKLGPIGSEKILGGHKVSMESSRSTGQNAESLMQVYRSLDKGDFVVDVRLIPVGEIGPMHNKQASARKPSCEILKFMDKYIFNTPESKELLGEYLDKQQAYTSIRNEKQSDAGEQNIVQRIWNNIRGR